MSDFQTEINKRMQEIVKQQDLSVLQNLSIKNLFELNKMICDELNRRVDEKTKEMWKEARAYTTKKFKIREGK